jgi:hypothetical protein
MAGKIPALGVGRRIARVARRENKEVVTEQRDSMNLLPKKFILLITVLTQNKYYV